MKSISVVMIFLGLAWTSGCAGLEKRLDYPRITLVHIDMKDVKAFESIFEVTFRIFNTGDTDLEISGIDCELALNGRKLAVGVTHENKAIPSLRTDTVTMELYSSVIDMVRGLVSLPGEEKISYAISGRIHASSRGTAPFHVPFSEEGKITMGPPQKPYKEIDDSNRDR